MGRDAELQAFAERHSADIYEAGLMTTMPIHHFGFNACGIRVDSLETPTGSAPGQPQWECSLGKPFSNLRT